MTPPAQTPKPLPRGAAGRFDRWAQRDGRTRARAPRCYGLDTLRRADTAGSACQGGAAAGDCRLCAGRAPQQITRTGSATPAVEGTDQCKHSPSWRVAPRCSLRSDPACPTLATSDGPGGSNEPRRPTVCGRCTGARTYEMDALGRTLPTVRPSARPRSVQHSTPPRCPVNRVTVGGPQRRPCPPPLPPSPSARKPN